jgi:hypothetical protein
MVLGRRPRSQTIFTILSVTGHPIRPGAGQNRRAFALRSAIRKLGITAFENGLVNEITIKFLLFEAL